MICYYKNDETDSASVDETKKGVIWGIWGRNDRYGPYFMVKPVFEVKLIPFN